jgi:hypothetical protein
MDLTSLPRELQISFVCILFNSLIIIIYFIAIISYVAKSATKINPLNIEALDYALLFKLSFIPRTPFSYTYFFIIMYGIAAIALFYLKKNNLNTQPLEVKTIVNIVLTSSVVAFIAQLTLSVLTSAKMIEVRKRTEIMNQYICQNLYKKLEFLSKIERPAKTIFETNERIIECLKLLETETDKTKLAKGFYTLTLYYYYQSFSLKNENIYPAFKAFDYRWLLTNRCDPASYFPRYGTFIEEISETLLRPNMKKTDNLNEALYLCDSWISKTNEYANTIYPESAFDSFVILLIGTSVILSLIIAVLVKLYRSQ